MRREKLKRMANSIGRELKKCPPGDLDLGRWSIPNATESGPLYFETLHEVEIWLIKNDATFEDVRKKKRGRKRRFSFRASGKIAAKIEKKARDHGISVNDAIVKMISDDFYEALILDAWLGAGFDVLDTDDLEPDFCAMLQDLCEAAQG